MNSKKLYSAALVLAAAAVAGTTSSRAQADGPTNCTVANVKWTVSGVPPGSQTRLMLYCSEGVTFWAQAASGGSPTCTGVGMDSMRAYLSIAQAAKLAGKTLAITWNTCSDSPATNSISQMQLNN
jgi:hypothetical protein